MAIIAKDVGICLPSQSIFGMRLTTIDFVDGEFVVTSCCLQGKVSRVVQFTETIDVVYCVIFFPADNVCLLRDGLHVAPLVIRIGRLFTVVTNREAVIMSIKWLAFVMKGRFGIETEAFKYRSESFELPVASPIYVYVCLVPVPKLEIAYLILSDIAIHVLLHDRLILLRSPVHLLAADGGSLVSPKRSPAPLSVACIRQMRCSPFALYWLKSASFA